MMLPRNRSAAALISSTVRGWARSSTFRRCRDHRSMLAVARSVVHGDWRELTENRAPVRRDRPAGRGVQRPLPDLVRRGVHRAARRARRRLRRTDRAGVDCKVVHSDIDYRTRCAGATMSGSRRSATASGTTSFAVAFTVLRPPPMTRSAPNRSRCADATCTWWCPPTAGPSASVPDELRPGVGSRRSDQGLCKVNWQTSVYPSRNSSEQPVRYRM